MDQEKNGRNHEVQQYLIGFDEFFTGLADEGERSLVIGGAARVDVALESLLKNSMRDQPGGNDDLFDTDRPLGTFSAKIRIAYRLGLIDDEVESILQMVRRIRNDFAHATRLVTLSEPPHRDRVMQIGECFRKRGPFFDQIVQSLVRQRGAFELLHTLTVALTITVAILEQVAKRIDKFKPPKPGTISLAVFDGVELPFRV